MRSMERLISTEEAAKRCDDDDDDDYNDSGSGETATVNQNCILTAAC